MDSDLASTELPTCLQCLLLNRALHSARTGYIGALRSEFFKVSTLLAARKQVDLERARLAYVEHRLVCSHNVLRVASQSPLEGVNRDSISV